MLAQSSIAAQGPSQPSLRLPLSGVRLTRITLHLTIGSPKVSTSSIVLPKSSVPPKVAFVASAPALSHASLSTASHKFNKKLPQFRKINTKPPSSGSQPSSSSSSPVSARPIVAQQGNTPRPVSAGASPTGSLAVAEAALPRSGPASASSSVTLASPLPTVAKPRTSDPGLGKEARPSQTPVPSGSITAQSLSPVAATASAPSPWSPPSAPKDVAPVTSTPKVAPVVAPSTEAGEKSDSEPDEPLSKSYDHRWISQSASRTPPVVPEPSSTTPSGPAGGQAAFKQGGGFKKRSRVVLSDSDSEASRPLAQRRTSGNVVVSIEKGLERAEEGRPSIGSDGQTDGVASAQGQTATRYVARLVLDQVRETVY